MSLQNVVMVGGGVAVGAGLVVVGLPAVVGLLGFGATGIASGSVAAGMMTGATQAGSVVAICQSIGATGAVATSTGVLGGVVGGVAGYFAGGKNPADAKSGEKEE